MTKDRRDLPRAETFSSVLRRVGHAFEAHVPGEDAAGRDPISDSPRRVVYPFATFPESGNAPDPTHRSLWEAAFDWIRADEVPATTADNPPQPGYDETTVAAELGLAAALTPADLQRIRRAFALQNHPDRLHPSRRDNATRRMTTANALIDKALKSKRVGH